MHKHKGEFKLHEIKLQEKELIKCLREGLRETLEDYFVVGGVDREELANKSGIHLNTLTRLRHMRTKPLFKTIIQLGYALEGDPLVFINKVLINAKNSTIDKK